VAARFGRPRVGVRDLRPFALAALVLGLAGPWFASMAWRYGVPYVRDFFGWHHVRRAISDDVGARPPWYLLQAISATGNPGAARAVRAARGLAGGDRDPVRVLAWAGLFPLVFFSIPFGKRNVYLLPGYPMLAVALAPFLAALLDGGHPRLVRAVGRSPRRPPRRGPRSSCARARAGGRVVGRAPVPRGCRSGAVPRTAGSGAAPPSSWGARRRAVGGDARERALLPALGRYMPVPRLAAALVAEARPGDPAVVYGVGIHSLMFYARRPTVTAHNPAELLAVVPPGGRAYVLGEEDELGEVPKHEPLRLTVVARAPQFRFHFGRNVLGHGESVRDLVLVRVERTSGGAGEGAGEGARPAPR
jgi:hypothetical protein